MKKNKTNILISNCYDIFQRAIAKGVFPGAAIAVSWVNNGEKLRLSKTYGYLDYSRNNKVTEETIYDLASLTKPLATTQAILVLLKEGSLKLSDLIKDIFPEAGHSFLNKVTIKEILSHSAGLPPYRPYYLELVRFEKHKRKEELLKRIFSEKPDYKPGIKSVYSDIGFILLGLVIEKITGLEPALFFSRKISSPLGIGEKIFYLPDKELVEHNELKRFFSEQKMFAPTEDCHFRKRVICGEVSDENAFVIGGLSGHAGLFANIGGILEITEKLLAQWQGRAEHPNYRVGDLHRFLLRQGVPGSTWALGFDTPAQAGSSGGRYLDKTSVGHLGFTGTSFWIDPTRDLVMILLSNRVHPTRENNLIKQFRPLFHDTVIESLGLV